MAAPTALMSEISTNAGRFGKWLSAIKEGGALKMLAGNLGQDFRDVAAIQRGSVRASRAALSAVHNGQVPLGKLWAKTSRNLFNKGNAAMFSSARSWWSGSMPTGELNVAARQLRRGAVYGAAGLTIGGIAGGMIAGRRRRNAGYSAAPQPARRGGIGGMMSGVAGMLSASNTILQHGSSLAGRFGLRVPGAS